MPSKSFCTFFTAIMALFSVMADAAEIEAWPCPGCSEVQFKSAAAVRGPGIHYLYDFGSGNLKGFEVTREAGLIPGTIVFFAEPIRVRSGLKDTFDRMVQVRGELGDLSKIVVEVSVGSNDPVAGVSAYDVVQMGSFRNNITDWLRSQSNQLFEQAGMTATTAGNLSGFLQGLDKVLTQGELLSINVVITLTDGSKVAFEFSRDNAIEGFPEYIKNSARDVNDNPLIHPGQTPENGTGFDFRNDNSAAELERWLNHTCLMVSCVRPLSGTVSACTYAAGQIRCLTY